MSGSPPNTPSIDLELDSALAAAGSGAASASQQLAEFASGDSFVAQNGEISQVSAANIQSGNTSTLNAVDVSNLAEGVDSLDATLNGGISASVANSGSTDASGSGAIAADASSLNNVQQP